MAIRICFSLEFARTNRPARQFQRHVQTPTPCDSQERLRILENPPAIQLNISGGLKYREVGSEDVQLLHNTPRSTWTKSAEFCRAPRVGAASKFPIPPRQLCCNWLIIGYRLKCDRRDPCANCTARRIDCQYAPHPRSRETSIRRDASSQLDSRIRHLEHLVSTLAPRTSPSSGSASSSTNLRETIEPNASHIPAGLESVKIEPGRMSSSDNQTIYVSGAHWTSICNEVRVHCQLQF